jgi:hypothetical protein
MPLAPAVTIPILFASRKDFPFNGDAIGLSAALNY